MLIFFPSFSYSKKNVNKIFITRDDDKNPIETIFNYDDSKPLTYDSFLAWKENEPTVTLFRYHASKTYKLMDLAGEFNGLFIPHPWSEDFFVAWTEGHQLSIISIKNGKTVHQVKFPNLHDDLGHRFSIISKRKLTVLFDQSIVAHQKTVKKLVQRRCICWNYDDSFVDYEISEEEENRLTIDRELFTVLPCPISLQNFEKMFKVEMNLYLPSVLYNIVYEYIYMSPLD